MSDKHNQELLDALTKAFAADVGGSMQILDDTDYLSNPKDNLDNTMERLSKPELMWNGKEPMGIIEFQEIFNQAKQQTKVKTPTTKTNKTTIDKSETAVKSTFAAYSYDKTTPVPLPASITTEAQAVQYMEDKGYKYFEVYLKLGTYKAETKTEMVRQ